MMVLQFCDCESSIMIYCSVGEPSFPSLMSSRNLTQFKSYTRVLAASHKGFSVQVEMKDTKLPAELGSNGRSIKMMPTSEVMKNIRSSSVSNTGTVNSTKQVINGASKVVNGVYIIKRETASSLVERSKVCENEGLPPLDEPIVLQTDTGFSWANDSYSFLQRSIDVWSFVMSLYVRVNLENAKWAYIGGFNKEKQKKRRKITAAWMRERMLQLGPTFIKLGQLLSSRSDLFPREYVDEMSKLQDRVPAFSPKKARGLIAEELGAPIDILFKVFEDQPLAAASLGQVHRAILHNGERVAIKVQRPGLKRLFDVDLRNLKLIAEYFQNGERLGSPIRDWVGVYEECAK
uniref:ABC1 atypical kinase-like domain-containing protein n=1 Tax=Opuntia streptacantha TaxID=393608 RepID=A0A7C9DY87_OPUST